MISLARSSRSFLFSAAEVRGLGVVCSACSVRPTVVFWRRRPDSPAGHVLSNTPPANYHIDINVTTPPLPLRASLLQTSRRFFPSASSTIRTTRSISSISNMGHATNDESNAAPASSWLGNKGAAAFDLRSDTMTTPTAAMLQAIQTTTLLDDVFEEDSTTIDLEAHVAALAGKEAGLFVLSGTMGNQIALRALLTQPPHSVLCHVESHINKYEAGGVATLSGALLTTVKPTNGRYLTLEDVQANVILGDNVHVCPTRVISLENTLAGLVTPLAEVQRIAAYAREHGILMHCDGARLWEVVASGAGSLADFCACFDTVSLCFSKGLGAPIGSIIVGSKPLIKHGRWIRKAIGGGLRQSGVVTAAARVAVDTTFGTDSNGRDGLLKASHATALRVEKMWTELGGRGKHTQILSPLWV
ncbi:pyridoxal phosphate-dependent transferase [Xylaria venustula]|nr:pyridoxal phosphate-dependent transferase [Xylaria venustula]